MLLAVLIVATAALSIASAASGAQNRLQSSTFAAAQSFQPCPNDTLRTGVGARLPDCRAYEQASAVDKNGADVTGILGAVQASVAGDAVTFLTLAGVPGGTGAQDFPIFLARRGATAWSTSGTFPPASYGRFAAIRGWTPDLSQVFSDVFDAAGVGISFLSGQSTDGSIRTITPHVPNGTAILAGASADGNHVFFESSGQLTPDAAPDLDNLYLWDRAAGTLTLAGVLPPADGATAPPGGSFAGAFDWFAGTTPDRLAQSGLSNGYFTQEQHVASADGDKVFFTAGDTGQIYVRQGLSGLSPQTVQVSASQRSIPDPNGAKPAIFMAATPSGSKAFFTSCQKLTDDATAVSTADDACDTISQGQDLYAYDTASGDLADITPDTNADLNGADVKGVVGTSDDGSYVYFAANGVLAPGATAGDCSGVPTTSPGSSNPYTGTCSLYLWHAGTITLVARLDVSGNLSDGADWQPGTLKPNTPSGSPFDVRMGRVSADGRTLLLRSQRQLTASAPAGTPQFYRFHLGDPDLLCITCDPTGAGSGGGQLRSIAPTLVDPGKVGTVLTRNLSSDGDRVFFETSAKLVAADTNGSQSCPHALGARDVVGTCQDVYEWEAEGSGSCTSSDQNGGCLYLISGGTGAGPSFLADASASGDDVFLFTRDPLVPGDRDALLDVYDARVGGGLAAQHVAAAAGCVEDTCQGPPSGLPPVPVAASVTFIGSGNATAGVPSARATVLSKTVHGASFLVSLKVAAKGQIAISGATINTVRRALSNAGTYRVRVTLTPDAKRRLARKHIVKLKLRVTYQPAGSPDSTVTVTLTVKPAIHHKRGTRARRSISRNRGDAR